MSNRLNVESLISKISSEHETIEWSNAIDRAFLSALIAHPIAHELTKLAGMNEQYTVLYWPLENVSYTEDNAFKEKLATVSPVVDKPIVDTPHPPLTIQPPRPAWESVVGGIPSAAAHAGGWKPNAVTNALGGPSGFTSALGSGLLGAGLGYGAGALIENLAGKHEDGRPVFEGGHLRKMLGLGGLGLGTAIPLWANSHGWFNPDPVAKQACIELSDYVSHKIGRLIELEKEAALSAGGIDFMPSIAVDAFNRVVLEDPMTPLPIRSATVGLVSGAGAVRNSPFVSPADVGRIAMGMGSGYMSGMLVGKTLGALAGLSEPAQRSLQDAGIWAGLLKNTIPLAFDRY